MTTRELDCTDVEALLSGLADGELEPDLRHRAERHLVRCAACTAALERVERLDEMVRLEAGRRGGSESFDDAAIAAVLARTVRTGPAPWRRAVDRLGWLVAAAAIGFIVISGRERLGVPPTTGAPGATTVSHVDASTSISALHRSWTYEGDSPAPSRAVPVAARPDPFAALRPHLDAIDAAGVIAGRLAALRIDDFSEIEQLREIVEYDELLPRIAAARAAADELDRPSLLAIESLMLRIVHGPIEGRDLQDLRDLARALDLKATLGALGERASGGRS